VTVTIDASSGAVAWNRVTGISSRQEDGSFHSLLKGRVTGGMDCGLEARCFG
jgi:hypothetical protein